MTTNKETTLSTREMQVLALAWQCMETQPKINMAKLSHLTGYTPGSASVTFGNIKRKIKLLGDSLSAPGSTFSTPKKTKASAPTSSSSSSSAKKRGASSANGGGDETPSKKAKTQTKSNKNKKKGGNGEHHGDDDEEEEEFTAPRIKKEEVRGLELEDNFWTQAKEYACVKVEGLEGVFDEGVFGQREEH